MYTDDNGLRVGRVGKAWTQIPTSTQVSPTNLAGRDDKLTTGRIAKDPRFERLHCDRMSLLFIVDVIPELME